jgi:hypothetical protein
VTHAHPARMVAGRADVGVDRALSGPHRQERPVHGWFSTPGDVVHNRASEAGMGARVGLASQT